MLRVAVARSNVCLEQGLRAGVRRQRLPQRIHHPAAAIRSYADVKQSDTVAGVRTGPISATITSNPAQTPIASTTPPTPTSSTAGALPPPGASTTPPPPPPKKPRRRFRNFLLSLAILSALGYAGGVYYSLVSDNFHDFFTEYIPYGEDAVAYFEEREFRRRFPQHHGDGANASRNWPQKTGEQKITIGRQSGLTARVASETDLGSRGPHVSGKEPEKAKPVERQAQGASAQKEAAPSTQAKTPDDKAVPKQDIKKDTGAGATKPADATKQPTSAPAPAKAAEPAKPVVKTPVEEPKPTTPPIEPINHLTVPEAEEPAVQELVAFINRIITVTNASPEMAKYKAALGKEEVQKVLDSIALVKQRASHDAEDKIQKAHQEFDNAAKELVSRLEREMQEQELKWREEYESEREKLSQSYQQKLSLELDAAKRVAEQQTQNSLLSQEIALQQKFLDSVRTSVEAEREGRLAKLDELSSSVSELEDLTAQWNSVVDATLQTQHLQVALEAVRSKIMDSEHPTPFVDELVALKDTSSNSPVITAAIASIPPQAYTTGIPTPSHLIDRFRRVASEVRKASLLPEDAGIASHAASAVLSRLMFSKKADRGLPEGDDVEATLARTETLLEEGDLDAAAREMNGLKGWAGVLGRDWVGECRRVLEVRQAVDVIAAEARLQSLLVG